MNHTHFNIFQCFFDLQSLFSYYSCIMLLYLLVHNVINQFTYQLFTMHYQLCIAWSINLLISCVLAVEKAHIHCDYWHLLHYCMNIFSDMKMSCWYMNIIRQLWYINLYRIYLLFNSLDMILWSCLHNQLLWTMKWMTDDWVFLITLLAEILRFL